MSEMAEQGESQQPVARENSLKALWRSGRVVRWLFDAGCGPTDCIIVRWLFLRALAGIYFSAFFSLLFQIKGLIGPQGILPAKEYLEAVSRSLGILQRL